MNIEQITEFKKFIALCEKMKHSFFFKAPHGVEKILRYQYENSYFYNDNDFLLKAKTTCELDKVYFSYIIQYKKEFKKMKFLKDIVFNYEFKKITELRTEKQLKLEL